MVFTTKQTETLPKDSACHSFQTNTLCSGHMVFRKTKAIWLWELLWFNIRLPPSPIQKNNEELGQTSPFGSWIICVVLHLHLGPLCFSSLIPCHCLQHQDCSASLLGLGLHMAWLGSTLHCHHSLPFCFLRAASQAHFHRPSAPNDKSHSTEEWERDHEWWSGTRSARLTLIPSPHRDTCKKWHTSHFWPHLLPAENHALSHDVDGIELTALKTPLPFLYNHV